jgi:hypothetical protein
MMYLDYLVEHKARELAREANQHRLAKAARASRQVQGLSADGLYAVLQTLRAVGTRLTNSILGQEATTGRACVECPAA